MLVVCDNGNWERGALCLMVSINAGHFHPTRYAMARFISWNEIHHEISLFPTNR